MPSGATAKFWMVDVAKTIESTGYESLWVFDHFHTVPVPTQEVTYEAWTLMASLAAVTDTVRLGQMCTCNSYRPPSYLAKVASNIDVISNGSPEPPPPAPLASEMLWRDVWPWPPLLP